VVGAAHQDVRFPPAVPGRCEHDGRMIDSTHLDNDACYRASAGRDSRWDGRFYLGVVTTGIYCRPSCPARKPLRQNCTFFPTAAAAVAGGFRACKRCRPDALPGSRHWDSRGDLAARAVRMIRDGVVDEVGVAGLASRLAVSERQLLRVLVAEVGATAQQLNKTRRAHAARTLIDQTSMALGDVAFAAGFGSVRQFNDVMRAEFGVAPSTYSRPVLRQSGDRPTASLGDRAEVPNGPGAWPISELAAELVLHLAYRLPFAVEPLRRFLLSHSVPGLDDIAGTIGEHSRIVSAPNGPALVTIVWPHTDTGTIAAVAGVGTEPPGASGTDGYGRLLVRIRVSDLGDVMPVVAVVRRWLDLDAVPALINETLWSDPILQPLIAARPGLRLPGAIDGAETALFAVLGQQVSLKAARTFSSRLVTAFGLRVSERFLTFPDPGVIAGLDHEELRSAVGITNARARALQALAAALANGVRLVPGSDRAEVRSAVLALPGIGPWTADYIALRCLGDPDAFPADDLVLKRALGVTTAKETLAASMRWRPWRGYALMQLWTGEVFS
jgi:AraC family transcriptional regulator of adaptative response / DNA-3-methyladenine glycosylase II